MAKPDESNEFLSYTSVCEHNATSLIIATHARSCSSFISKGPCKMARQTCAKATPTVYFVLVPDPGAASAKQARVEVPCRFARPTEISIVSALRRSVYAKEERLPPTRRAQGRHNTLSQHLNANMYSLLAPQLHLVQLCPSSSELPNKNCRVNPFWSVCSRGASVSFSETLH